MIFSLITHSRVFTITQKTHSRLVLFGRVWSPFSTTSTTTTNMGNDQSGGGGSESPKEGRSFFKFHPLGTRPEEGAPKPPVPPKDFNKTYTRRPMFNFAMEGNHAFKEANNIVIYLIAFNLVCTMGYCIWYKYYYYDTVLTPEERDALYQKTKFPLYKDEGYQKFRAVLSPLIAFSDIGRFGSKEYGNMNQDKPDDPIVQVPELSWTDNPVNDIVDRSRVLTRDRTGRKNMTLKDFDAQFRN